MGLIYLYLYLYVIYFYIYFYIMSKCCLRVNTVHGNGSWNSEKHKKREPRICFLRAEFRNITNPLGGFPVPLGVPSNVRVLVMKLCRACCHISLLPSWRLMTLRIKCEGSWIFVRIFRYRYCGCEAMCGFLIERFDSKLAGVEKPLVRQLGRKAESRPMSFKSSPRGTGIDSLVGATCRRWPC